MFDRNNIKCGYGQSGSDRCSTRRVEFSTLFDASR